MTLKGSNNKKKLYIIKEEIGMYINGIEVVRNIEDCILSYEAFMTIKNSDGELTPMKAILGKDCPKEMDLNQNTLYVFRRTQKGGLVPLKVGFDYTNAAEAFPPRMTEDQLDVEKELRRLGI